MSEYDSAPQPRPGDEHQQPEQSWQNPDAQPVSGAEPTHPAQPVSGGHWQPGAGGYAQSGWPGQPAYGPQQQPTQQQPTQQPPQYGWGQATTLEHGRPGGPNRAGRFFATGAAAIVLAVGSGLLGGVIATSIDNGAPASSTAADASRAAAAPVINRSSLAEIATKVQPGVVQIQTGSGEGSGVVMSADGAIVTNNHVVATARGNSVQVVFNDGRKATATIVGTDPRTDLAVVKAQGVSGLTPVKFGDSDGMQIGDTVLALGSPLDLQGSVTAGIISAKNRTISVGDDQQDQVPGQQSSGTSSLSGLLQTDAAINPGNSGGALVNTNAELIGINSAIATSGQGSSGNIGIGFAIPSNKVKSVTDALLAGKKVSHPYLGVQVSDGQNGGAVVSAVSGNSPAAKAGLQEGDVITKIGDKGINGSDDVVAAVQAGKAGEKITVTYTRNGSEKTATVTLGEAS